MNRSLPTRLFAPIAGALVLFSGTGDVLRTHSCPHHGHVGVPGAAVPHRAAAWRGGHPDAVDRPADRSTPAPEEGPCTCAGPCHGSAPELALGTAPPRAPLRLRVRRDVVGRVVPTHPHPSLLPFFQPYPNGPPPAV